jgi:hypothetical protein
MSCKVIPDTLIVVDRYQPNMVKSNAKKPTKAGKTKSKSKNFRSFANHPCSLEAAKI